MLCSTMTPESCINIRPVIRLRWVSTAPLTRPVVPDVNRIVAGSSGWASPGSGRTSAARRAISCPSNGLVRSSIRPAYPPSRISAARRLSASTNSGVTSSIIATSSAGDPRLLSTAAMPPAFITAMNATIHSARLRMQIATRSPRLMCSIGVSWSRQAKTCSKVSRRSVPSEEKSTRKVLSPCRRACSIIKLRSGAALANCSMPS